MNVRRYLIRLGRIAVPVLPAPQPQLGYEQPSAWRYAWRSIRRAVGLVVCLGALAGAGGACWVHLPGWYWYHQCSTYALPPNEVVLEDDETAIAALTRRTPSAYRRIPSSNGSAARPVGRRAPAVERLGFARSEGTLFLHGRETPGGKARVVGVMVGVVDANATGEQLYVGCYSMRPAPTPWSFKTAKAYSSLRLPRPKSRDLRLFAGQPDANDPSHFTIAYVAHGQPGTIDGWLADDEIVQLKVRDGPLK
jgi:hypothetical protein